jgi:hypothetical protein
MYLSGTTSISNPAIGSANASGTPSMSVRLCSSADAAGIGLWLGWQGTGPGSPAGRANQGEPIKLLVLELPWPPGIQRAQGLKRITLYLLDRLGDIGQPYDGGEPSDPVDEYLDR